MGDDGNKGKRIILVEDELFVRELYERVIRQEFEVLTAGDGEEGLALIQREAKSGRSPDLVLLDVMMPKLNGIDVLRKLKESNDTANIPVILLTNLGQEEVIKEASDLGAKGYLMKIRLTPYEVVGHIKDFLQNPTVAVSPS